MDPNLQVQIQHNFFESKVFLVVLILLGLILIPTAGYFLNKMQYANKNAATTYSPTPKPTPNAAVPILSLQEKAQIDAWITKNNLNTYGDLNDTAYPGGTPLFNEATGERTDRYIYIAQNHINRPWCTPRPPCLDSTPRCLIAETPQMCPAR